MSCKTIRNRYQRTLGYIIMEFGGLQKALIPAEGGGAGFADPGGRHRSGAHDGSASQAPGRLMLREHWRAAVILLLVTSSSPAYAAPLTWPQRLAAVRQCYAARQIFMEAAGDASSLLWWASSDNHRSGYLDPSVVIEARQRVQEMIAAADWRFTNLAAREHVDAQACRQNALDAGSRIMQLVREILAGSTMPQASQAQHSHRPSLR